MSTTGMIGKWETAGRLDNATELSSKSMTITNKILKKQLEANPWNRRNIISLWDYDAFEETEGLLPCAFQTMFDVRRVDGEIYLDATFNPAFE